MNTVWLVLPVIAVVLAVAGIGWFVIRRRPAPRLIFVSYSHEHRDLVRQLIAFLKVGTDEVFYDEDLQPGDRWEQEVTSKLAAAKTVIVFWCSHAAASVWLRREIALAIEGGKKIVPVLLEERQDLPKELQAYQWIDLSYEVDLRGGQKGRYIRPHSEELTDRQLAYIAAKFSSEFNGVDS